MEGVAPQFIHQALSSFEQRGRRQTILNAKTSLHLFNDSLKGDGIFHILVPDLDNVHAYLLQNVSAL